MAYNLLQKLANWHYFLDRDSTNLQLSQTAICAVMARNEPGSLKALALTRLRVMIYMMHLYTV